jgi:hypothetical protein
MAGSIFLSKSYNPSSIIKQHASYCTLEAILLVMNDGKYLQSALLCCSVIFENYNDPLMAA